MKNTLVALALAKTLWDSNRRDHLDAFLPLLALVIQRRGISQFRELRPIQEAFLTEWGLAIPYHAVASIVNRARKRNLFTRSAATYYPVLSNLRKMAPEARASERRRRVLELLDNYSRFSVQHGADLSQPEAETALIAYLRRQSETVHVLAGTTSPLPDVRTTDRALYLFARFVAAAQSQDHPDFRTLVEVWLGHALVNAVVLPEVENLRGKLKGLKIFLDAPLIFNLLGFSGAEAQYAADELMKEASSQGAVFAVFHHTYDEVFGILESTIPWLTDLRNYDPSLASATLRHFVDNNFKPSDVETVLATLPRRLETLSISSEAAPGALENIKYQIDEMELGSVIREVYRSTPTDLTIDRDVQSIAAIYRLRRDALPRRISETRFVFLTSNHSLATASRRYELRYVSDSFFIPAAVTDVFLGTILWLESPRSLEKLSQLQLMTDVQDLLEPKESLLKRFAGTIQNLAEEGRISSDEYIMLRTSRVARSLLQELTLGDPLSFSHRTPEEILEHIKQGVRDEERREFSAQMRELESAAEKRRAESERLSAERRAEREHLEDVARRIASFVAGACFVLLSLGWIAVFTFLAVATDATGWFRALLIVITVVLSAGSLIVPVVDARSLSSRLRARLAARLTGFLSRTP